MVMNNGDEDNIEMKETENEADDAGERHMIMKLRKLLYTML